MILSFGSLIYFSFSIFIRPLQTEFGWTRGAISLGASIALVAAGVSSPIIGYLIDRHGAKPVIAQSAIVLAAGLMSLSFLRGEIWEFYAIYLVIGVVGNGTTQLPYSKVIVRHVVQRRGLALAMLMAGVGAGGLIVPLATEQMIDTVGWRQCYRIMAIAVLASASIPALLLPRNGRLVWRNFNSGPAAPGWTPFSGPSRILAVLLAFAFFFSFSMSGFVAHLQPIFVDRGLAPGTVAAVASAFGAATVVGRLFTGPMLDLIFAPHIGFVLLSLAVVGILIVSLGRKDVESAYAASVLLGVGLGAEVDLLPFLLTRYFGTNLLARLYGIAYSLSAVAAACGAALMGWRYDLSKSYSSGILCLLISMVVATFSLLLLPRYSSTATEQLNA